MMRNHLMVFVAKLFCRLAHFGQRRKYTNEPYYLHPFSVACLVSTVTKDWRVIVAALLHDTVEDTWVRPWMIRMLFGDRVAELVAMVTDVSTAADGNRKVRKAIDRDHIANADSDGQTIKLADLIDNTLSIVANDPKFAKVYIAEKMALLDVLTKGDRRLHNKASDQLDVIDGFLTKCLDRSDLSVEVPTKVDLPGKGGCE